MDKAFRVLNPKLAFVVLGLALSVAACSKDGPGSGEPDFDDCESCRQDNDSCKYKENCQPGSICNKADDPDYVADKPVLTCVRIACDKNADCEAPKTCSLSKSCQVPTCQSNFDCAGGTVCIGGSCQARPDASQVAACEVLTRGGSIKQGDKVSLVATAKNANGKALPAIGFTWSSNDMNVVSVSGNLGTGGAMSGQATISAAVDGNAAVRCTGEAKVLNFAAVGAGEARVILIEAGTGRPLEGATVWITDGAGTRSEASGATGAASFAGVNTNLTQVTAYKDGYQYVTVVRPGTKDVFLPINKRPDVKKAGGFRGNVDISSTAKKDLVLGIVGPSLPANVLDLQLDSFLGDFVPTPLELKEFNFKKDDAVLPGGMMFGLGTAMFTDDSKAAGLRCQGDGPGAGELGCFAARAPEGSNAGWLLAGQLSISDPKISPLVSQLTSAFGAEDFKFEDLDVGLLVQSILPLLQRLNHGIHAGITTTHANKVPVPNAPAGTDCSDPLQADNSDLCMGDFSKYTKTDMAANQKLSVLSRVTVPELPKLPDGKFAQGMLLIAGAQVPGRGLVPLGISGGIDANKNQTSDGKVAGGVEPFGPKSAPLEDGQLALAMAAPHSGIEGSQLLMAAMALDPQGLAGSKEIQLSTLVERITRVDEQSRVQGSFLPFPKGKFDRSDATFRPDGMVAGANLIRILLEGGNGGKDWVVYAPQDGMAVQLPDVGQAIADVQVRTSTHTQILLQVVKTASDVNYAGLFEFGSGQTADKLAETVDAFVIQQCSQKSMDASCAVIE